MAAADLVTPPEIEPGPVPARPGPAPAGPPAPAQPDQLRPLEIAHCSMCGVTLPLGLLVPDGGQACDDIRWYCKDARSCTERWTTARPPQQVPAIPAATTTAASPAAESAQAGPPAGPPEEPPPAGPRAARRSRGRPAGNSPDGARKRVRAPQ
jgi:hypothetical protein